MEKPFLPGNLKLDEASLKRIFLYNLNHIYPILLHLKESLPLLAKAACYGDLQNVIEELVSETKVQLGRVNDIFVQFKEIPVEKNQSDISNMLQALTPDQEHELFDELSKDLLLVFYLQKVIAIERNYFYILKSIATLLNSAMIKQYLQHSYDECEDNQTILRLIAKEYMDSTINTFLQ